MKNFINRLFPRAVFLSEPPTKSRKLIVDILITVLLFTIAEVPVSLILTPCYLGYIYTSIDLSTWMSTAPSDPAAIPEYTQSVIDRTMNIINNLPAWINIVTLFTFIFITLAVIICRVKIEKGSAFSLGFSRGNVVKNYSFGLLIGAGIFSLAVAISAATGGLRFDGVAVTGGLDVLYIILFLLGFIVQGMAEEVLCRGYLMTAVARRHSVVTAVIVNSVFFAALHVANNGLTVLAIFNLVLFGVFASMLMLKTNNIWIVCAVHTVWNFLQGNFYGISVSGMAKSASVFSFVPTEFKLMSGGAFGLEGALSVTVALLIGILMMALIKTPKSQEPTIEA